MDGFAHTGWNGGRRDIKICIASYTGWIKLKVGREKNGI